MPNPAGGVRHRRPLGVRRRRGAWLVGRVRRALGCRSSRDGRGRSDAGMTTAEYAVGTLGACALAAGLYKVVTSAAVIGSLTDLLDRALHAT
ncbi:DUF4244 domain-containing protein [Kitasatospora sp. CM 4170]|uniref:DUF4244 domain-containing protein n=2 Tax=Streptomycetaceae TaxID=2062 RepID=A0ABW1FBW9_9ACTN|nr:DUF4244 domain-containing protein [Kitasatospora sp. CM 4170]WNM50109.1 DUF4244 domain-containing protein [Kitasatospora sp. CM 4170]